MTSRPHDDSIDPLLRAAARQAGAARTDDCLEPDVIASWADGRLDRAEAAALESHAASCARCRAVLAAFAQTTPAAPVAVPWWKAPVVRWAAPLAAAAGAAIIWVTVDRPLERDRETPTDAALSARSVVTDRDAAPVAAPATAAEPPERPGGLPKKEAARAQPASPSRQVVDSVKPAPAPPAPAPPLPGARPEAAAREHAADALGFQAATDPLALTSPDKTVRWRVLPGRIERSTDAGATWEPSPLATAVPLTTGACPANDVCWLAGAAGTVLRTTDGRTWTMVTQPDPADIQSITPADALNAVVTTADGRSFATTDGGRTWSLQEVPAAPFKDHG